MTRRPVRRTEHLLRKEEKEAYKRLLLAAAIIIFLIFTFVLWGFQILVKFAEFLDLVRNTTRPPVTTQDTIAPLAPRLYPLPTATNSARLQLMGFAESGSTVEIFLNNQSIGTILVGGDGNFKNDLNLKDGDNRIEARAIDKAGNQSTLTSPALVTFDKTPPALEVAQPADGSVFSQDRREIIVSGETDEGTTVTVNSFWAIVEQSGNFSYNLPLSNGENKITIEATDTAGNKRQVTKTVYLY